MALEETEGAVTDRECEAEDRRDGGRRAADLEERFV
jgi:hypothetical protein